MRTRLDDLGREIKRRIEAGESVSTIVARLSQNKEESQVIAICANVLKEGHARTPTS